MTTLASYALRFVLFLLMAAGVARAQNMAPPMQAQSLGTDWRQRGVTGNLLVDDTEAINKAVREHQANGGQFNWANNFRTRVRAAIIVNGASDFSFVGTGPSSAVVYCGDGTQPVFELERGHTITIRDLGIYGHWGNNCTPHYARAGISWDEARPGNWTASNLLVDRVIINPAPGGDIKAPNFTCIDISNISKVNVEDGKFYNIVCQPQGGIGFHIGPSPNPKNEIFFNDNVGFGQYGYKFESGGYHVKYGECGNLSEACLYLGAASDPVSVEGLLSEANKQFVRMGSQFGPAPVTFSHINNGWDEKATAPCFWDIGGAQFLLAISNSWSNTNHPTPHSLCGNERSSGIFINNSFAWKLFGSNAATGYYNYLPPPADLLQLHGSGYAFYGGSQITLGATATGAYSGINFIQTTGSLRSGLRYSTDTSVKTTGALPVAANHLYIGDGVLEFAGPGAPQVQIGCLVTGGDTSQHYGIWVFALDSSRRRSVEGHAWGCHGPPLAAIDDHHTFTFRWEPQPEAASYDVVLIANGTFCYVGNTENAKMTVHERPACKPYSFPSQNEAEFIKTRGRGISGFGPSNERTPTWSIDTATGTANFSGGLIAPKLTGISDAGLVANLNADRVDGKHASDFTAAPVAAPKTSNSTCTVGSWAYDSNYVYVCVAANSWRRTALAGW